MKRIHHKLFKEEFGEDQTKFGEFICTFHEWLPLDKQKKEIEKLEKITKKKI